MGRAIAGRKTHVFDLRRREFITLLGGAAATWPLAARAQPPTIPVIGYLSVRSSENYLVEALRRGLAETGYVEGQTVAIEYRWAMGQYDRMPAMAAELARRPVTVLVTAGGEPAARSAKAATSTIPIVFVIGGDPVKLGLVASYNRPGGNATGTNILTSTLEPKRLGLLHQLVPQAKTIAVLLNPNIQAFEGQERDVQEAASALGVHIYVLRASSDRDIEAAFETVAQQRIAALAVGADAFFDTRRDKLVALAARKMVPTIYQFREFATVGGLLSYGIALSDSHRQIGVYVGQILKGAKPADLPVLQPTKLELIINLKAARALGLQVPDKLLALADDVIE
jgi:putative tryptophan/tyrosine transport system substrate-binding protein